MAETKSRRKLFKVAKELNLSSDTISDFLQKKGFEVKGPNTRISDEMYEEILKRFTQEKIKAEKIAKRRQQRQAQEEVAVQAKARVTEEETPLKETTAVPEQAVEEAEPVSASEALPVVEEKTPAPAEIMETEPETSSESSPAKEEVTAVEEPVVSPTEEKTETLETPETSEPSPEESETSATEPAVEEKPAEEAKTEEPVIVSEKEPAEEETAAVASEVEAPTEAVKQETAEDVTTEVAPEDAGPKVGDIIDHPMARKYLEKQKEKERQKKEKKKRAAEKKAEEKAAKEVTAETVETEEIPRRAAAATPDLAVEEEAKAKAKGKGKKKKGKKTEIDEIADEKERRRRKALEMIRKEGRQGKRKIKGEVVAPEEPLEEIGSKRKKGRKKKQVDQQEVEESLKKTLASMRDGGGAKKRRKKVKTETGEEIIEEENVIAVTEFITVQDLANLMGVSPTEIITKCLELGQMVTINQRLEMELIKLLAEDFGFKIEEEEEFASDYLEEILEEEDNPEDYVPRHPVVTVMGHVDHGKTSLLDYIRHTNVVAGESGGITQHIGAYVVNTEDGRNITFLDTPGHEAFTAMRSRGAQVTDIVVLVVAADDRVMPQTEEAIDHARAAGVPLVIAINKVDKPNANPQAIRKQLAEKNILVEDWGGSYQVAEVSAKTGQGIDELMEKILLEAELLELKANPKRRAVGVVVESRLDKGKGPVATVLIQQGTLKVGDVFIVGQHFGRVRAMLNERDQRVDEAGPAYPVQVLGIEGVPEAGDKFIVMPDEKQAREIANRRQQLKREQDFKQIRHLTLDEISRQIREGEVKELNLLVKADVDGSAQALTDALLKLSNNDVSVKVIRRAVGPITESDIMLAAASQAIIIGFHVRPTLKAKELAEEENVDIRQYKVIYDAIEDVKLALEGLLEPEEREQVLGLAEVRETFKISRIGTIAGCYILNGKIHRNSNVRLVRNDVEIYTGKIASLKRFKEDVREVVAGYECGIMIENYNDIKVGDHIEAFEIVQEKRKLES
ncbi:MAG: hypothetical protein Kow0037_16410 [Calditrichia bacterium]